MNPSSAWIAKQNWEHILFLHWSIPKQIIEPYIPAPLQLDTFDDRVWITVVTFRATNSQFRYIPSWMAYPPLTQINVRTYVKLPNCNKKGIYFFSLNVNSLIGTLGANYLFGLPFNKLTTTFSKQKNPPSVKYKVHDKTDTLLCVKYVKNKQKKKITNRELTEFLTERYIMWTKKGRQLIEIPITHYPWSLVEVDIKFNLNNLQLEQSDKYFPFKISKKCSERPFLVHYCPFKQTKLHLYKTIGLFD